MQSSRNTSGQAVWVEVSAHAYKLLHCILDFSLSQKKKNSWSPNDTRTYSVHVFMGVTRTKLIANRGVKISWFYTTKTTKIKPHENYPLYGSLGTRLYVRGVLKGQDPARRRVREGVCHLRREARKLLEKYCQGH